MENKTLNKFKHLATIPYGAVYFRKSNPPVEDWERDYRQAAKDGMNTFRHWFVWSGIEVAPGVYDWEDYDRQFDLAGKYGIKTIIADILGPAPEWAFREYPHARVHDRNGQKAASSYRDACAVSGMPGLCFDNDDVLEVAENFMRALVARYRDHPALGGYDVWNEQNTNGSSGGCYCDGSAGKFRAWLQEKYGDLDALARAWHRYSYRDWDDIEIPRHGQFYGDEIDWQLFRIDNAYKIMKWRIDLIREIDPVHPVTAHADTRKTLRNLGPGTYQAWKAAGMVDGYGNSGGCNHEEWSRGRWAHWLISDSTRSASGNKPFWAAEVPGGYTWRLHGNPPMDNGRMSTADDIRLHHLTHMAGGATGVFSPRWRPLLNGTFTGHFAYYGMDGSPTDRSEMVSTLAKWANHPDQKEIWEARPVEGDMGMVVVPESQIQCYLLEGSTDYYYHSIAGAFQGFLFNNIQVDFVNFDQIPETGLKVLYLPHPLMLPDKVVQDLKEYVRRGGILISEGCPAYYGDHGRAGEHQPNYGLDKLFGAVEERVEFTPVLLEGVKFKAGGKKVTGGVYLQSYIPAGGTVTGTYGDGTAAVVDHEFGNGKVRLIGTCPGYGFYEAEDDHGTREFFGDLLEWTGLGQLVKCSVPGLVARVHQGGGYQVLWVVNSAREPVTAELEVSDRWGPLDKAREVVNRGSMIAKGRKMNITVPARDAVVIRW